MEKLKQFVLAQLNFFSILDIFLCLLVFVALFVFLKRKKSLRLFAFSMLYLLILAVIRISSIVNGGTIFTYINELLTYVNIFLVMCFVSIFSNDIKASVARATRKASAGPFHNSYSNNDDDLIHASQEIVRATQNMSKNDIGALIVIVPTALPEHILATGTMLNSELSSALLESIFNPHSPLHDGAVIVSGNCIVAAGCFLPLSQEVNIDKELGTRHRAAIGITEQSDVLTIVVSEETGIISTVYNGEIKRYMTPEKLINTVQSIYGINNLRQNK